MLPSGRSKASGVVGFPARHVRTVLFGCLVVLLMYWYSHVVAFTPGHGSSDDQEVIVRLQTEKQSLAKENQLLEQRLADVHKVMSKQASSGSCKSEGPTKTNDFSIVLKIIAYKRVKPLQRLLNSLSAADYEGDNVALEFILDSVVHNETEEAIGEAASVRGIALSYHWPHGPKTVHWQSRNVGLVRSWLNSWYPSSSHEYAIVLEDDMEVSKVFYRWSKRAIEKYLYSKDPQYKVDGLCGFSLYNTQYTVLAQSTAVQHVDFVVNNGNKPYLFQNPMSWGPILFPTCWREFREWVHKKEERMARENPLSVLSLKDPAITSPFLASNNWKHSWLQYFIRFFYEQGRVFLYPNLANGRSFAVHHFEAGHHFLEKRSSREKLVADVDDKEFVFPAASDLSVYDVYSLPVLGVRQLHERGRALTQIASSVDEVITLFPFPDGTATESFKELKHNYANAQKGNAYVKYFYYLRAVFPNVRVFRPDALAEMTSHIQSFPPGSRILAFTTPALMHHLPPQVRGVVCYFEGVPDLEDASNKGNMDKDILDRFYHVFHSTVLREVMGRKYQELVVDGYRDHSQTFQLPPMYWTHRHDWPDPRAYTPNAGASTSDSEGDGGSEAGDGLPVILIKLDMKKAENGTLVPESKLREAEIAYLHKINYYLKGQFRVQYLLPESPTSAMPKCHAYVSLCTNGVLDMDLVEALYEDKIVIALSSVAQALDVPSYKLVTLPDSDALKAKAVATKISEVWEGRSSQPHIQEWVVKARSLDKWYQDMGNLMKSVENFYGNHV